MYYEVIPQLSKKLIDSPSWQKILEEILGKAKKRLDDIGEGGNFPEYKRCLYDSTISEYKKVAYQLFQDRFLTRQEYNRIQNILPCNSLLFHGTLGSGKSSLEKSFSDIAGLKVVNLLSAYREGISVDEELEVKRVRINQVLNGDFSQIPEIVEETNTLLIIDTIEELIEEVGISLRKIIETMDSSTKHKNVRWVITSSDHVNIICNPLYSKLSSFQFKNQSDSGSQNDEKAYLANWYDLDLINIQFNVSQRLWCDTFQERNVELEQLDFYPPALIGVMSENADLLASFNEVNDIFKLLVHYIFDRLNLNSADRGKILSSIKQLEFFSEEREGFHLTLDFLGSLNAEKAARETSINQLINTRLILVSESNAAPVYKINIPLLWAYFFAVRAIEESFDIEKFREHFGTNSSLESHFKIIYQYYSFRSGTPLHIEQLCKGYGSLEGAIFLLNYSGRDYGLEFLNATYKVLSNGLSKGSRLLNEGVYHENLLTYALYRCLASTANSGYDSNLIEQITLYIGAIFKLLTKNESKKFLLSTVEVFLDDLHESEAKQLIPYSILKLTEYLRVSESEYFEVHDSFLFLLSKYLFKRYPFGYRTFFDFIFDKEYKKSAYSGFYRFSTKFLDAGFTHFLASSGVVYKSVEDSDSEIIFEFLAILIRKKAYRNGTDQSNFDKLEKIRFLARSSFHKAIGNRIRKTFTMHVPDAKLLIERIAKEYSSYKLSVQSASERKNLTEGLLRIFKHIDIANKSRKSNLPTSLQPIIVKYINKSDITRYFNFVEDVDFIESVYSLGGKLCETFR
ncbi:MULTISPECIES: hypothetical protein [unclassified Pseudoalteromonas]|uniref:hypothetical protein n=1 Tax=unclassified Pseudoalteromonas TaxID=194690 RepID=UPI003867E90C